jgi:ATP-dependent Clp protease ATP-binding subunit ClpC
MFEKYTEAARKVIFFARYEASQLGGEYIDTEHLLLGVFRSDPPLARRVLKSPQQISSIREQVEKQSSQHDKVSVSVDLPLTKTSRTVLTRAAKEAELANHPNICPEHLFLALILVEGCTASKILIANGVTLAQVKREASNPTPPEAGPVLVPRMKPAGTQRDLTLEARDGKLSPLIGRERELESIIRILSRRDRSNPVLIGEPGVGKDALVRGLAQKIADGDVPANLDRRPVIAIEASALTTMTSEGNAVLYVHGLFDLPGRSDIWNAFLAQLSRGGFQCIATGTAAGYRMTMEKAAALTRHFEVVAVPRPTKRKPLASRWE